nr:hypothetical protein [Tanacetum cinerariifolium]
HHFDEKDRIGVTTGDLKLLLSGIFLLLFGLTKDAAVKLMLLEDVIRQVICFDDADGMECLPNEEIFTKLTLQKGLRETNLVVQWRLQLSALQQGRKDDDNAAIKEVSVDEPTMFDDEEMAKRLHDEEIEQVAAREKQEKDDLEKDKVLQKQYKMEHFKGMTYDKESFKKLKAVKVLGSHSTQDTLTDDPKEMSKEDVKNMLEIVPVSEFKVEALQVKYPLID